MGFSGGTGFRTTDRELREVLEVRRFRDTEDLAELLPDKFPPTVTTTDIANAAQVSRTVAQQVAFCFRALGVIAQVDRTKVGIHYSRG